MKALVIFPALMMIASGLFAQPDPATCKSHLDSSEVISIAKKEGYYKQNHWLYPPTVVFDSSTCTWRASTTDVGFTRAGECARTNGCTTFKTRILVIDAITGDIRGRDEEYREIKNYE